MGVLDPQLSSIIFDLRVLRNRVAHEQDVILSQHGAKDYVGMAERLVYLLESMTDKHQVE